MKLAGPWPAITFSKGVDRGNGIRQQSCGDGLPQVGHS